MTRVISHIFRLIGLCLIISGFVVIFQQNPLPKYDWLVLGAICMFVGNIFFHVGNK
jgi:predicted membrane channel-forming protein YqfA (hemolysin III family)